MSSQAGIRVKSNIRQERIECWCGRLGTSNWRDGRMGLCKSDEKGIANSVYNQHRCWNIFVEAGVNLRVLAGRDI
jgi:hypothetical protein